MCDAYMTTFKTDRGAIVRGLILNQESQKQLGLLAQLFLAVIKEEFAVALQRKVESTIYHVDQSRSEGGR